MLRRLIKVSVAVIGLGLAATACSSLEMGAAATGSGGFQRITIATLGTEVTNLSQAARQYPGVVNLTASQMTQDTLTWLVRFQITEELARQQGITISTAQAEDALNSLYNRLVPQFQAAGLTNVTLNLIMAVNGIPPNKAAELGRYEAIGTQFAENANGGVLPTTNSAATATNTAFQHAQCVAAKSLNILINPQFGRLDYSQLLVAATPVTVSRAAGPASAPTLSGLAPAC